MATPVLADPMDKKSIYDMQTHSPSSALSHSQQTPTTRLAALLRDTRGSVSSALDMAQTHGQILVSRWIGLEQRVADVVRRTVPEGERLAPGIIYVGVAALAGPIFTRRRNFAVRWMSPLVFGAAAGAYFLPGTTSVVARNVWTRYGDPATIDRACEAWQSAKLAERRLRARVAANVQELRMSLQEGRGFSKEPKDK
ncbi:hypothetical protein GGI20_003947 [Coemansia sp. BCRC 34301]|nr:hypothetical protein GGI20_003947 [Coemansia sp. BCRC 34301]